MRALLRQTRVIAMVAVIGLLATACGTALADAERDNELLAQNGDSDTTVTLDGLAFSPETVEIEVGDTVEFVNAEDVQHDVTFDDGEASETLEEGDTYTRTFDEPGEFDFECTFHPSSMQGTVVVADDADAEDDHDEGDHDEADAADLDAAELRITLERLLGQHVVLATEAMRAGVTGSEDFEAAGDALRRNTEGLTGAIELVYGAEGAETFEGMWQNHIDFFVDYTVGVAEDDQEAQDEALERLDQYRADFSQFLEEATEGQADADQIAEGLQVHVDQLVSQIDAFADEDYETAFNESREAFAHMFVTAQGLAGAIVGQMPDEFPGELDDHETELRSDLGLLLSEHAALAIQAMRAGVEGAPEFEAADGALMANTQDLTAAIEGIYGEDAAEAFMTLWQDHIDFFVQYTVGVAEGDEEAQDEALERLSQYKEDFSGFLEDATDGNVPAEGAAEGLQVHVDDLIGQIDAYAADDFAAAYDSAYDAYAHMFGVAEVLADGIAVQMADEMPEGGVDTGGGGIADDR